MKTPEEIEHLKQNWASDPCWDIEDTEGFEEHREELKAFSQARQQERKEQVQAGFLKKAAKYGREGDEAFGQRVSDLEGDYNAALANATRLMVHYLSLRVPNWDSDNTAEVESMTEYMVDAAVAATLLKRLQEN